MTPEVIRILDRVPGIQWSGAAVTPLTGGLTNRNFRIDAPGGPYVLRIGGAHPELLGIDRRHEHAASVVAAALGIGPEVVAFVEDEAALVTRFIAGTTITPGTASRPELQARIAASIRRFHAGPKIPGVFSVGGCVRDYVARAKDRGAALPADLGPAMGALAEIERATASGAPPVPCHNDLLAGNFIDDGATIRVLDWEYAAMGDALFDLGNFAANLRLDAEGCAGLLAAYAGPPDPVTLARVRLLQAASDLRESTWGLLQTTASTLNVDYAAYAREHLARFRSRAADPDFPALLRAART